MNRGFAGEVFHLVAARSSRRDDDGAVLFLTDGGK
jgi:hypothetical protein